MMSDDDIAEQARRLIDLHGDKAGRQAAYNELGAEENDDDDGAHMWHRVCLVLKEIEG